MVFTLLSGLSVMEVAKGTNIHFHSSPPLVPSTSATTSVPNSSGDGSCDVPDLKSKNQRRANTPSEKSPETKDEKSLPPIFVGEAKVSNGALPLTDEGEASGTAGELGLGKLAMVHLTTGSIVHLGKSTGGITRPNGYETEKTIDKDPRKTRGNEALTTP